MTASIFCFCLLFFTGGGDSLPPKTLCHSSAGTLSTPGDLFPPLDVG